MTKTQTADSYHGWIPAFSDEYGRMVDAAQVAHRDAFCEAVVPASTRRGIGPQLPATSTCPKCADFVSSKITETPADPTAPTAESFLRAYSGTNTFLNSVKDQLLRKGSISPAQRAAVERNMTSTAVSPRELVEMSKPAAAPAPVAEPAAAPERIPTARYCVPSRNGGKLAFFNVQTVTEGKWAGWTFVKQVIGGHDDERVFTIRPNGTTSGQAWVAPMLEDITADLDAARMRYVTELKRCWHCGRILTDVEEAKRNGGLGPVCVNKY